MARQTQLFTDPTRMRLINVVVVQFDLYKLYYETSIIKLALNIRVLFLLKNEIILNKRKIIKMNMIFSMRNLFVH